MSNSKVASPHPNLEYNFDGPTVCFLSYQATPIKNPTIICANASYDSSQVGMFVNRGTINKRKVAIKNTKGIIQSPFYS